MLMPCFDLHLFQRQKWRPPKNNLGHKCRFLQNNGCFIWNRIFTEECVLLLCVENPRVIYIFPYIFWIFFSNVFTYLLHDYVIRCKPYLISFLIHFPLNLWIILEGECGEHFVTSWTKWLLLPVLRILKLS